MSTSKKKRHPIRTTDSDGTPIVQVPLKHSDQYATLYAEDFDRIMELGYSDQWWPKETWPGCCYAFVSNPRLHHNNLTVARLVVEAQHRQIVKYHDGDRFNLRRGNLHITEGATKRPAILLSAVNN